MSGGPGEARRAAEGRGGPADTTLTRVLASVRRRLRRGAGVAVGLSAGAAAGAVMVLAWLLAGTEGWHPGTPVPLLLLAAGALGLGIVAGRTYFRLRRWTREASLAREVERVSHLPDGSVRAQAELARSLPRGVSGSLVRAGEGALLGRIGRDPAHLAGSPGRMLGRSLRLAGAGAALAALLVASIWLLSPERARTAWAGLARPAALLVPAPLLPLEVSPGDATLPRGSVPRLEVTAGGRDSVQIHWRAVGEVFQERTVGIVEGRAEVELPPLDAEMRYWVSSPDGARTAEHVLRPTDPSLLSELTVRATFPPHTRIPEETFRTLPERLDVPEGTVLAFSGGILGEGSDVVLRSDDGGAVARFPIEEERFSGSWSPAGSIVVDWEVEGGRDGALLPPSFEVEVIPDQPPELSVPVPAEDGDLPLSLRVPMVIDATDDYGVAWVEVEAVLRAADGGEEGAVADRVPTGDRPSVTLRPTLDFSEWGLRPGDEVLLTARASDNAPRPQVTQSRTYRLRMPPAASLRDSARDRIEASAERAAELLERAVREARELRELERSRSAASRSAGDGDGGRGFQEREEAREVLERQAELADQVEEIREDLSEARGGVAAEDPANQELRERIRELEQMLEELVPSEMRERLEELLEALRDGELPESSESLLEEAAERQEELRERLERVLEQLERSVLEESFRGAEEELRALVDEQQELAERLGDGEGAERQDELARVAEAVQDRIQELEQRLREAGESGAGDRTAEAAREMEAAREAMDRASEAAEQGASDDAGREAGDAADALGGALQELEEARAEWSEDWWAAMRDALRRGAQDALSLARAQHDLRTAIEGAGRAGWGRYELDEAVFLEALRNLANDLDRGLRQVPSVARQVSEEIGAAMRAVEQTMEELRDRLSARPDPGLRAERAQDHMNRVAVLALLVLEQMEAEAEEGDPAMDALLEELAALAAEQEALNEEARSFAEDPEGDGAAQDSGDLALAQEAIAGALQDLANRPGGGETTADLEELADEGRDIAEELAQDRLDATTLDRQDLFLERLLSAGRTFEREGPTEEREGTTAGPTERRIVSPLPETLLEAMTMPAPSAEALEALTPGQRRLVLDYFERVGRREAGGAQP